MKESSDRVRHIEAQWRAERPDLDPSSIAVVTRIWQLAKVFGEGRRALLRRHGIEPALMDLLGTLRRSGQPYALATRELAEQAMVTPAAISQRLTRAETRGWVTREPAANRTTLVRLTASGLGIVDDTAGAIFEEESALLGILEPREERQLAALLEKLSSTVATNEPIGHVGIDSNEG